MKVSRSNSILAIIIMVCLLALIVISIFAGIILRNLSFKVALSNPDLQHLRIPVLLICLALISIFIINLVLAEILLGRIILNTIFTKSSGRLLKLISWFFIAGIFPLLTLYILTERNVDASITQIYVILFGIVYLTAGLIFRLWANLIKNASQFKEEVDMTV
ncbi:MAG: DUF2975 domain-containing protein [Clostridia bacterium]